MKIIEPEDLVPTPLPLEKTIKAWADKAWLDTMAELIKGKLILTGNGIENEKK